ncbi:MAG TPA: DUF2252 family protein [Vicinamibacterales bacterium]|jgi:hypothetical protein|nr:DUF2252 family protein [Vicinamibacterales bacterium]
MDIAKATRKYEAWLADHLPLVKADLTLKHRRMRDDSFSFMRGTFYRWAQLWPDVCARLVNAPRVLAVADLHIENFGTWRDTEGRLIWGVNDFDEVFTLPYTNDLVRLATSAALACETSRLAIDIDEACEAILSGYTEGVNARGQPYVLEEHHIWLRRLALTALRDPVPFWHRMDALRPARGPLSRGARRALESMLPAPGLNYRVVHRVAGLGSLGRERLVALAEWGSGRIAREAKGLAPSACTWALDKSTSEAYYEKAIASAVRVPDPFVSVRRRWIVRRLAPDCSRMELASLPKERDEAKLLYAMGWETANVHLGTRRARKQILSDLRRRPSDWLEEGARRMRTAVLEDWKQWRAI